eukprot:4993977-Amphidinium_carterae.1
MHTWRNLACVLVSMVSRKMIQKISVQPLRLAHMPLREHSNIDFDMVAEFAIELARILKY